MRGLLCGTTFQDRSTGGCVLSLKGKLFLTDQMGYQTALNLAPAVLAWALQSNGKQSVPAQTLGTEKAYKGLANGPQPSSCPIIVNSQSPCPRGPSNYRSRLPSGQHRSLHCILAGWGFTRRRGSPLGGTPMEAIEDALPSRIRLFAFCKKASMLITR